MRFEFRSGNSPLEKELRGAIERRLRFVLGRFTGRITRVTVLLEELLGQRVSCRIAVTLRPSGRISIEDTDSDLSALASRAVDRTGDAIRRELARRRE